MAGEKYLEEAHGLNVAVGILCRERKEATLYSIGILAAHCLELALKAYLLHVGCDERDVKKIGHDLGKAWERCKKSGLGLDTLPYWVQVLDYSHSNPYFFRYPSESHNVAIPSIDDLPENIDSVLGVICSAMRS